MEKSKYITKSMIDRSVAFRGSDKRLKELLERAERGDRLTLCFLGGSITQGSVSSVPEKCYAYLVYTWFRERFPRSEFIYVNAGIGGTTSQFGIARLEENVIPYKPDFCMIEFSVNDSANLYFREAYEGLVRRVMSLPSSPAVLIMNNLFYDTGLNTQDEHNEIGKAYDITCISVRDAVRPEIRSGRIVRTEISPDGLHPNDEGHRILAELVADHLEKVYAGSSVSSQSAGSSVSPRGAGSSVSSQKAGHDAKRRNRTPGDAKPEGRRALTTNALEHLHRTQNRSEKVQCCGFKADRSKKKAIWDIFKHGWTAGKVGDSIKFEFTGSELAIQYRKTIDRPAPVAIAVIDGNDAHGIVLDANFEENWGNHLNIDTLMYHGCVIDPSLVHNGRSQSETGGSGPNDLTLEALAAVKPVKEKHTVELRICEAHENDKSLFYLVSFITG